MTTRRVLTDEMWARLEPLLPDRSPQRGGRWRDHRDVVEAIVWRFRTGSPWRDLPADLPAWQTVWWRFDRWSKDGTWDRVLAELQAHSQAAGEVDWLVSVDSTIARAHQHAAGAPRVLRGGRDRTTRFRGRSRLTTLWAARGEGSRPRPTPPWTATAGCWRFV